MALTGVETIAVIFAVVGLIKLVGISLNKGAWYNSVASKVFNNAKGWTFVFGVLAIVVFYYLLQELTLAQIVAGMAFGSLLTGLAFMSYSKELSGLVKKIYTRNVSGWMKLYIFVWGVLMAWVFYDIFI
jgi:hypothetical protein